MPNERHSRLLLSIRSQQVTEARPNSALISHTSTCIIHFGLLSSNLDSSARFTNYQHVSRLFIRQQSEVNLCNTVSWVACNLNFSSPHIRLLSLLLYLCLPIEAVAGCTSIPTTRSHKTLPAVLFLAAVSRCTMSSIESVEPLGFFSLPRELRDEIVSMKSAKQYNSQASPY